MIRCKRCGKPAPVGAVSCQYCGTAFAPLANTGSGEVGGVSPDMAPRGAAPDQRQQELPAWLESLRSSERPAPSPMGPSGPAGFSAGGLVDEGMLPAWMRPDRTENADTNPSGVYPTVRPGQTGQPGQPGQRPASMPVPNTDGTFTPVKGMSASSLIDEQSLPPWLQEKQVASSPSQPMQEQQMPQANIPASSLIQTDALPDWMRTMQAPAAGIPNPPMPYAQPPLPPQGIAGNDLIEQQSLPPWLSGQNAAAPPEGQAGFAASSLLDMSVLPPWLREAGKEAGSGNADALKGFPPAPPAQPMQAPAPQSYIPNGQVPYGQIPSGQGQVPTSGNQIPQGQAANSLSAASFIDVNALPEWLRSSEDQRPQGAFPPQQGMAENPRQASFGVPPRPENMRVPTRPRGEMGVHEESEVAANVFASMLGVASAAPQFPGQPPRDAYGQPQMTQQQQLDVGAPPMQGNIQQLPPGYQGGYPMGNMPGGMPVQQGQQPVPMNVPGSFMNSGGNERSGSGGSGGSGGQPKQQAKPTKRGFLSTILEWFQFSRTTEEKKDTMQ